MNVAACSLSLALPLVVVVAGCAGVPEYPDAFGRGLVAADSTPPEDAGIAEQPSWSDGDWFRYVRGGTLKSTVRVRLTAPRPVDVGSTAVEATSREPGAELHTPAPDEIWLVEDGTDRVTRYSQTLGQLGELRPEDPWRSVSLAPGDDAWVWPIWKGKRWSSHFARRIPGAAVPILAEYHCDARERITVPAGTFDTFRVWRRARPDDGGRYLEDTSVFWYAPSVGWFVRRLADGVVTELEDWHSQE